jgi:hypothetical protein
LVSKNAFTFTATLNEQTETFTGELAGDEIKVWLDRQGREMAAVDPILAAGYYGLGTTYLGQKDPEAAIEPLAKAAAIQRTDGEGGVHPPL